MTGGWKDAFRTPPSIRRLLNLRGIRETSWRKDRALSVAAYIPPLRRDFPGGGGFVRLWVEHPDGRKRTGRGGKRFSVVYDGGKDDVWEIISVSDSAPYIARVFMAMLIVMRRDGRWSAKEWSPRVRTLPRFTRFET